jgi:hypothetical protein
MRLALVLVLTLFFAGGCANYGERSREVNRVLALDKRPLGQDRVEDIDKRLGLDRPYAY